MKAVRLIAANAPLEVQEVADPEPGAGDVVVKVAGCGVCHTDIGFWRAGVATRQPLPLTLGHEISGTVVSAAPGHEALLGRAVIVPAVIPCGECDLCRQGRSNVCRAQLMPGNDIDGGFAELVRVPARGLCVVTDAGSHELAELSVIADAVTTPYQAIVRSGLRAGELAVFVGVGGVGTYGVQIAAALGGHVIAIDVDADKLRVIEDHGARLTIDSSQLDTKAIRKQVAAAAASWNVPAHSWKIFECSGHPAGQETAFGLLTYAATLLVIGFTLARTELRLSTLMALDATVQGTWGCRPELYPEALRLVTSGAVAVKPFIECHQLSDAPAVLQRVADHGIKRRAILLPN
ncbi:MAG TPA: 6-hydroxycyclohex-1-ene-1-carbonyl-CoA dehydrogenase [Longimicrobiales bacterium]|nr:6-hydroxycyclohex-1-ene-1-carbonyl-CoA dehydrogenase [Longimicrobiales bacterium]